MKSNNCREMPPMQRRHVHTNVCLKKKTFLAKAKHFKGTEQATTFSVWADFHPYYRISWGTAKKIP
ncbi:MAG: hypothetical protein GY820_31325 [Gammaproteobacteria bacterium]|nr:hypothetical protein [Gammaproteobacteria bacterium]